MSYMSRYRHSRVQRSNQQAPADTQGQVADAATLPDEVKSVDQLAKKYGFAQPDEVAGPANGATYLDYGRPFTISDSARTRRRTSDEMWADELHGGSWPHR